MSAHPITWLGPAMLWPDPQDRSADANAQRSRPAILRFATDDFMTELLTLLATEPKRLHEFRARWETWREARPAPELKAPEPLFRQVGQRRRLGASLAAHAPAEPPPALKLYQPAHQRYYLIAASLVCQVPGLPDRKVDAAFQERAVFVIRRLLTNESATGEGATSSATGSTSTRWIEHGWVNGTWQPAENDMAGQLLPGEEMLPLFAVNFSEADDRSRRLHAGLIPVGKREAYLGGEQVKRTDGRTTTAAAAKTARKVLLRTTVIEPWKRLRAQAATVAQSNLPGGSLSAADLAKALAQAVAVADGLRPSLQFASWLVLLDLARFLQVHLRTVWTALVDPTQRSKVTETPQVRLLQALDATRVGTALISKLGVLGVAESRVAPSLAAALAAIGTSDQTGQKLEATKGEFTFSQLGAGTFPNFAFLLADADPAFAGNAALPFVAAADAAATLEADLDATGVPDSVGAAALDKLAALIVAALDPDPAAPAPAVPGAARTPTDALNAWFVIRCAYLRPECGTAHMDVVSAATAPFQMAGFFDPDAPARPIRIGLPVDTTPAGLRKFDKNTMLVMSDTLCGQVKRFQGVTFGDLVMSVLPWPFHKDLPSGGGACTKGGLPFGTICSISIPIITICALILLMIMVSLLDFVFRWMPYFILCFPLPKLDAKAPTPPTPP